MICTLLPVPGEKASVSARDSAAVPEKQQEKGIRDRRPEAAEEYGRASKVDRCP